MYEQLKKISYVSAGNIFNAVLGVSYLTAIARSISIEDFGKYAILTTLLVSMSKVVDFGSNSIFVAKKFKNNEEYKNSFLSLKLMMFFMAIVLGMFVLAIVGLLTIQIFIVFVFGLVAYALNITLFTFFQKSQMYSFAVGLNTLPALLKGSFAVIILLGMFTPSLLQAYTLFALSMYASCLLYLKLPGKYKGFSFSTDKLKELAFSGAPGGIALIVQHGWPTISNTIAKIAKDFANAGIFSIADKVANIFILISISVFTVLLPENAQRKSENKQYDFQGTLIISSLIILLSLVATVIGGLALPIIFGPKYAASVPLLGILIFASSVTAIHTFLDNYFYIDQNVKPVMYVNMLKLVIMVLLGFYLINVFDLVGLAYAQLISALIALLTTVVIIYMKEKKLY